MYKRQVADLAKAHVAAMARVLDKETEPIEYFNIGTGNGNSTLEIAVIVVVAGHAAAGNVIAGEVVVGAALVDAGLLVQANPRTMGLTPFKQNRGANGLPRELKLYEKKDVYKRQG